MRRKTVAGALRNFLTTFTSRNTDWRGYWLLGMLVDELTEHEIDLQCLNTGELHRPLPVAARVASEKFHEQIQHAGLNPQQLNSATLLIKKTSEPRPLVVEGFLRSASEITFTVHAQWADNKRCELQKSVLIAPHDPALERQRIQPDVASVKARELAAGLEV